LEKLKKIIHQTDKELLNEFEKGLKGNNSIKFHHLLTAYKDSSLADDEIREELKCNENSYYVLKSRLYDRIQKFLLDNSGSSHKNGDSTSLDLDHYIYEYPKETAIAMLQELETKYISNDSPGDLMNIYSALKKAHFYSEKYYSYSQLFNNQVAYALAIEKAEEILYKFNRTLATYHFSDSETEIELMNLLIKEIRNTYSLYKSPRVKLIHNIMSVQMILFAGIDVPNEPPIEDLLESCGKIIAQYSYDKKVGYYKPVITFLNFEYYFSLNQEKKTMVYFEEMQAYSQKWLLYNNSCLAYKFLLSKTEILRQKSKTELMTEEIGTMYFDPQDLFTAVMVKYYTGLSLFFEGNTKNAISELNGILNDVSFKNYFFIETEIKLALTYFYIVRGDIDLAESTLKGLSRKLMGLKTEKYKNVRQAIKLLTIFMNGVDSKAAKAKYLEAFEQFSFYNFKEKKVLTVLQKDLENLTNRK
jgi:hypothetical protein